MLIGYSATRLDFQTVRTHAAALAERGALPYDLAAMLESAWKQSYHELDDRLCMNQQLCGMPSCNADADC